MILRWCEPSPPTGLRTGGVREAKPLLEKLANREIKGTTAAADLDWARRGLAMVLSSSTDYRDFRQALDLVGLKLDENGLLLPDAPASREASVEMRRAKARVLATQPQRQFRVKAAQLLECLQPSEPGRLVRARPALRSGQRRGEGGRPP